MRQINKCDTLSLHSQCDQPPPVARLIPNGLPTIDSKGKRERIEQGELTKEKAGLIFKERQR